MRRFLKPLLLPPLNCFLLAIAGLALLRRKPRLGKFLLASAGVLLWLLSTPLVATALLRSLQSDSALAAGADVGDAGAIVVLSADVDRAAPEYGGPTPGSFGLQRLRYGAALHRATGLPVLVTGGVPAPKSPPQGVLMKEVLEEEFEISVRWVEDRSQDTWQNAVFSAKVLLAEDVDHVLLVTHAWHMPRARRAFEAAGMTVTPAPTGFRAASDEIVSGLLPRWGALRDSSLALHEYIGLLYYSIRYY